MSDLSFWCRKGVFNLVSVFVILFIYTNTYSQTIGKSKNVIWYTPSEVQKINGIAIGPFESTILGKQQIVNGLTFSIVGMGIFLLLQRNIIVWIDFFIISRKAQARLNMKSCLIKGWWNRTVL